MDKDTQIYLIDRIFKAFRISLPWMAVMWIALQIRFAIQSISGQTTIVDFVIGWFNDSKGLTVTLSFSLTIIIALWAILERRLRLKKVQYLGQRNAQHEQLKDPNRTSSGLSPDGTTHPRDK